MLGDEDGLGENGFGFSDDGEGEVVALILHGDGGVGHGGVVGEEEDVGAHGAGFGEEVLEDGGGVGALLPEAIGVEVGDGAEALVLCGWLDENLELIGGVTGWLPAA